MQELSIEHLKETELDILIEIDRFCRKQEIQYSLAGGTLLGAVRHKGFIPWDDDIDLMMTRENYDKFISLFSKEAGRYRVITYQNNPQYNYLFAKVVDSQTKVVEDHNFPVDDLGVFVDIFPIDALGDTIGEAKQKLKKVKFKRFLCVASSWKHFYINQNRNFLRQIPRFCFYLMRRFVNARKANAQIEKNFPFDKEKKYWGCVCGSYEEREIMKRDVFTEYTDLEFEGIQFMCIKAYDTYLSSLYHDYMKLPPQSKQVAHHTFVAYKKNQKIRS